MTLHRHAHGEHLHRHDHPVFGPHVHGWPTAAASCDGTDPFDVGNPPAPSGEVTGLDTCAGSVFMSYVPSMRLAKPSSYPTVLVAVGASPTDYWDALCQLSRRGRRFALVEQDIVATDAAVSSLLACPEPWCAHSYAIAAGDLWNIHGHPGLGLAAFDPEILRFLGDGPAVRWTDLDSHVAQALSFRGVVPHRHYPNAEHLHDYAAARG